jgi:hypothetical protein
MPYEPCFSLPSANPPRCFAAPESGTGAASGAVPAAEFVTFSLKDGVSDDAFVQAAKAISPYLRKSGNVVSRSLSRDDDGLWTDHIVWVSMKSAEETAAAVMQQPEFGKMAEMINQDSMNLRYASIVMQMD